MSTSGEQRNHGLFSPTSRTERSRTGKRLLWAIPIALAVVVLIAVFGPSADDIERKFTPYGATGPLRIMPEIAIEDGVDEARRIAASEATPPPPAPHYEVEPEPLSDRADDLAPAFNQESAEVTSTDESRDVPLDTEVSQERDGDANIDMFMPSQQVDSDFIIRKLVRPLYPARASRADRLLPLVTVKAAFFLNESADIVAIIVQSNDGGPEFATVVRNAMEQWKFEPRLRNGKPPAARWLVVTWRFRSPLSGANR